MFALLAERVVAQPRSVTENAPKSPFLCVQPCPQGHFDCAQLIQLNGVHDKDQKKNVMFLLNLKKTPGTGFLLRFAVYSLLNRLPGSGSLNVG